MGPQAPAHTRIHIPWPNDFADGFASPARGARRPRRTQGLPPRRPQRPQSMRRRTTMCAAKIGVARDVVSPRDPPTHKQGAEGVALALVVHFKSSTASGGNGGAMAPPFPPDAVDDLKWTTSASATPSAPCLCVGGSRGDTTSRATPIFAAHIVVRRRMDCGRCGRRGGSPCVRRGLRAPRAGDAKPSAKSFGQGMWIRVCAGACGPITLRATTNDACPPIGVRVDDRSMSLCGARVARACTPS